MFDGDLMVNGTVDLDMGEVWAVACNAASDFMRRAAEIERMCINCVRNDPHHPWCPFRTQARMLRFKAKVMMLPFQQAIAGRTSREREQAWAMARTGNLKYDTRQNKANVTHDCGRPMWQHIVANNDRLLCPFGREYWAYARAIDAQGYGVTDDLTRALLSMIATPTTDR